MKKEFIRKSVILIAPFILLQSAFAAGEYNNELLKMELSNSSDGSVKVNIYTEKPYKEQIIVNKKPDNKYVILLPETSNSISEKPDLSGVLDVKNIDVKTQSNSSMPGKGYTKITIDSKTPINIVPQAHVMKKSLPLKRYEKPAEVNKTLTSEQVQKSLPQRVLSQSTRPITQTDFVPAYEKKRQENLQKNSMPSSVTIQSQPKTSFTQQFIPKSTSQTQTQSPQNQAAQEYLPPQQNAQSSPLSSSAVLVPEAEQQLQEQKNQENDASKEVSVNESVQEDVLSERELAFFRKIVKTKQIIGHKVKKLLSVKISFSSIITMLQFLLLLVLIKIVSDLLKKVQDTKESSQPKPIKRLIHDQEETFNSSYPSYSNMDVYSANKSNFETDKKEGFNVSQMLSPKNRKSKVKSTSYIENTNFKTPQTFAVNNDFYRPLSEIDEEEKMSIFDDNAQDIEKTIFKNPLTPISKQDEETLFDEEENYEEDSSFVGSFLHNKTDEFFNYNEDSRNEEEFFIFEDDEENDENIVYQEDYIDEEDFIEENSPDEFNEYDDSAEFLGDYEDDDEEYEYVDDDEDYDDEEYEDDEEDYDEVESNEASDEVLDEVEDIRIEETPKETPQFNPFDHLTVHSKYPIDSTRGFALVSVENVTALIGYVGSKISVIRKFQEEIKEPMQVRINEKTDNDTTIYIVKIGKYKTLAEVKPNNIRQLLDL